MPGMRCCVTTCRNSLVKTKAAGEEVSYHKFPKPEEIRKFWIQASGRTDPSWTPAKLMGKPSRHKLKEGAIPSLYLPNSKPLTPAAIKRKERMQRKAEQQKAEKLVEAALNGVHCDDVANPGRNFTYSDCLKKICELKETVADYQEVIRQLKVDSSKKAEDEARERRQVFETEVSHALMKVFSENEKNVILGMVDEAEVPWTDDEILRILSMKMLSEEAFNFFKDNFSYPFPNEDVISRWFSTIQFGSNILQGSITMMRIYGARLKPEERLTVLVFGKMRVSGLLEYDPQTDEVIGPHNQMLVCVAQGLTADWVQPVSCQFDENMSKFILVSIIEQLHSVGYTVVALVSDCGRGNILLWKELGVTCNTPFFHHPFTKSRIHYFPDACHILKILRNQLLDSGFVFGDGAKVSKEPLFNLVEALNLAGLPEGAPRITLQHVVCVGESRILPSMAQELISHSTAQALLRYVPGFESKRLSEFIHLIAAWYDLMNVTTNTSVDPFKSQFGAYPVEQLQVLKHVSDVVTSMRCNRKNSLQVFQEGIVMCISSLRQLYKDLTDLSKTPVTIPTGKLTKNILQDLFDVVRGRPYIPTPTAVNALVGLRQACVSKSSSLNLVSCQVIKKLFRLSPPRVFIPRQLTPDEIQLSTKDLSRKDLRKIAALYISKKYENEGRQNSTVSVAEDLTWIQNIEEQIVAMNDVFKSLHGSKLLQGTKIVRDLKNHILMQLPHADPTLVAEFAESRILIRMTFINNYISKTS